jgi:beta-hydroxylase
MNTLPFYNPEKFSFAAELDKNWQMIYHEFLEIQNELIDYVEPHLYDKGWKVFGLWNLPHREPLVDAPLRCPITAALVEQLVPSHGAVAFSVLNPDTHIFPHRGKQGPYLRCHLPIEVPKGNCKIRVADQTVEWSLGKSLILDDRLEHEAWNFTNERRVVLLFDFIP